MEFRVYLGGEMQVSETEFMRPLDDSQHGCSPIFGPAAPKVPYATNKPSRQGSILRKHKMHSKTGIQVVGGMTGPR
jgi:hypothetical protein